jgi:hypothetical protein
MFRTLLAATMLVGTALPRTAYAADAELLSIQGISLGEKEYVAGFNLTTWRVEVLAVCHFPPGWTITAAMAASPDGGLQGGIGDTVAALDRTRLGQLQRLFLVKIEDYHEQERVFPSGGGTPPTFVGTISIGAYGPDEPILRSVPIGASNLVREPATRCPDPE